jgi:hypothetical protein
LAIDVTSVLIVAAGIGLTVSPLADALGFVLLPPRYRLFLAVIMLGDAVLTQLTTAWFIGRFGD